MIKILDYTDRLDYLVVAHTQPLEQLDQMILQENLFTLLLQEKTRS